MFYQSLYLFVSAFALAFLEVQIEGRDGWAAQLPTWRPKGKWYARFYERFMGGKELTGYHIGVFGFVLLFLHYPYLGVAPTLAQELWVLSLFFLFSIVWDYLWIVINPHYGVWRRQPKQDVSWHRHWWGPFPRDYYFGILLSAAILYPVWRNDLSVLKEWGIMFGVFAAGTILVLVITELVRGDVERK